MGNERRPVRFEKNGKTFIGFHNGREWEVPEKVADAAVAESWGYAEFLRKMDFIYPYKRGKR